MLTRNVCLLVGAILVAFTVSGGLLLRTSQAREQDKPQPKKPAPTETKAKVEAPSILAELKKPVSFDEIKDAEATLADVLEKLSKQTQVRITFNAQIEDDMRTFTVAGRAPIPAMKAPLRVVLQEILNRQGTLVFVVRHYGIEITTQENLDSVLAGAVSPGIGYGVEPIIIHEEFRQMPLEEALVELSRTYEVSIVIDVRIGEKAKSPVTARFLNADLGSALRVMTDMVGLDYAPMGNILYVTAQENAARLKKEPYEQMMMLGGLGGGAGVGGGLGGGGGAGIGLGGGGRPTPQPK